MGADLGGAAGVDGGVLLGDVVAGEFVVVVRGGGGRSRWWRGRFRGGGGGRGAFGGGDHEAGDAVLVPAVFVADGAVGFAFAAGGLDAEQEGSGGVGGAVEVVGLGAALSGGDKFVGAGELVRVADAGGGVRVGGDDTDGDVRFVRIGGDHGGDGGDAGVDDEAHLGGVGDVGRQDVLVKAMDDVAEDRVRDLVEGAGMGRGAGWFICHGSSIGYVR